MLGELLRGHRRRRGLSQEELADRSGVSVRTISHVETGRIDRPRPTTVRQLADALGLTGARREEFQDATTGDDPLPAPNQRPCAHPAFTCRSGELDQLDALLANTPQHAAISAIVGTAGVGKTALAVHWAWRHADRFPDVLLYVDLGGFHPTAPAEHADRAPEARIGLYRGLLAGKHVLVLIDALPPHPANALEDLDIDAAFVASLRAEGCRIPFRIQRLDGGVRQVDDGDRRFHGSKDAGLTHPPYEWDDDRDAAGQFLDMITTAQVGRIARAAGVRQKDVKAVVKVRSDEKSRAAVAGASSYAWMFEHMAALAAVKRGNLDWDAAEALRRKWITDLIKRRDLPKNITNDLIGHVNNALLNGSWGLSEDLDKEPTTEILAAFLGLNSEQAKNRGGFAGHVAKDPSRAPQLQFAALAAVREKCATRRAWRTDSQRSDRIRKPTGRWFMVLEALGYPLTPIEQSVVDDEPYDPAKKKPRAAIASGDERGTEQGSGTAEETDGQEAEEPANDDEVTA
ncbi:helix-turn-helix domain-containing protein [Streptomyces roseirectus]|nr:helix-turn-helix transcriptional regulator [Streptomyces roseirectus]